MCAWVRARARAHAYKRRRLSSDRHQIWNALSQCDLWGHFGAHMRIHLGMNIG